MKKGGGVVFLSFRFGMSIDDPYGYISRLSLSAIGELKAR